MKLSIVRCALLLSFAYLLTGSGIAQTKDGVPESKSSPKANLKAGVRAYPRVAIGSDRELEYVGSFSADGRFKPLTRFGRYVETMKTASVSDDPAGTKLNEPSTKARTSKIKGSRVTPVVPDVKASRRVAVAHPKPLAADLRDAVINFVYGPEKIFSAPQDVTTDSRQRVILTDPDAHAVHVLDRANKTSFSIVGGEGKRLQSPNGVAVDSDDNIYVSDSALGMVLVYDEAGKFLRYIGNVNGENAYEAPSAMAIDGNAGRLYLLDPPRNLLLILDLQGKELSRIGRPASRAGQFTTRKATGAGKGELTDPIGVALNGDQVFVLEANARVQVFDLQGNFRKQIELLPGDVSGFGLDSQGILYLSRPESNTVEAYDREGELLNSFGRSGNRLGEFDSPAGLWTDETDRLYIVDSENLRLQIFQVRAPRQAAHIQ